MAGGGGTSRRGAAALDWLDPLGIFPRGRGGKQNEMDALMEFGPVVGFGFGADARQQQAAYRRALMREGAAGYDAAHQGLLRAEQAANVGLTNWGYGSIARNQGTAMQGTAARGFTDGVAASQQGLLGAAADAQRGIVDAAAQRDPSQALIQQRLGLSQAQQGAQQLAATMSRGGNSALAQRAAQQQLAEQSFQAAQGAALIRAQEQAAYNQRQLAAQQAAGQIGTSAQQAAGELGLAGASGMNQMGAGRYDAGVDLSQHGLDTILGSGVAQGEIGRGLASDANRLAYDYATAQTNTDTGYAAAGAAEKAAQEAGAGGLLSGILGAFT